MHSRGEVHAHPSVKCMRIQVYSACEPSAAGRVLFLRNKIGVTAMHAGARARDIIRLVARETAHSTQKSGACTLQVT